jgi:hypothetical protein
LWTIEKNDDRQRMLIWMLELGRLSFDDSEAIWRFMNVEEVRCRFRALKRFKESATEARWNWLQSRAAFVLRDTGGRAGGDRTAASQVPRFDPQHVLFDAVPPKWFGSPEFQKLYGDGRISEANYTIFLRKVPDRAGERRGTPDETSPGSRQQYLLRYFGNAPLQTGDQGKNELRALKLNPPGDSYTEGLGTVFVAAAHLLGLQDAPEELSIGDISISQDYVKEKLQHHGFLLLRLHEFMNFLN